jgi:AraC family transcriptional regulator
MYDIRIEKIPAKSVTGLYHTGSYISLSSTFDHLFEVIGTQEIDWSKNQLLALFFDDPNTVAESELKSFAAVTTNKDVRVEAPLIEVNVRGGKYAILRHRGPYSNLKQAYNWLFGTWLITANENAAEAPCMEIYLNNPQTTAAADLLTDIYLPLN